MSDPKPRPETQYPCNVRDQTRVLRRWRDLGAVAMHPRLLARLSLWLNRGDGGAVAELVSGQLSGRETRRLAFSLLAKEPLQLTCDRDGFTWTVDSGDEVGESIYVDGRYEGEEIDAVLAWLEDNHKSTIVEVGANIGTTALPLAKAGYRVVAIEPVPTTFAMLSRNVEDNGFGSQVRCVNRAISTTSGHVDMWVTKGSGLSELAVGAQGPGFSQIGPTFDEMKHRITVESNPLDELLRFEGVEIEDIALVWSDAQGSESYVIETGTDLWAAGTPLYVEVDPTLLGLHGGLDAFVELVEGTFGQFLTRDTLISANSPQDIKDFRAFTMGLTGFSSSDALLMP
jgi:FkbM family methyltransferase